MTAVPRTRAEVNECTSRIALTLKGAQDGRGVELAYNQVEMARSAFREAVKNGGEGFAGMGES